MRDVWPGNRNIYRRGSSGSSAIGFAAVPIVAVTSVDPEFPLSTLFGPLCYTWPHVAWTAAKWCGFYREQPQRWWVFRTRIKLSKENCDIFSLQFMHYITFVIGLRLLYVWSTVYRHLQTTRQQTRYSCPTRRAQDWTRQWICHVASAPLKEDFFTYVIIKNM